MEGSDVLGEDHGVLILHLIDMLRVMRFGFMVCFLSWPLKTANEIL